MMTATARKMDEASSGGRLVTAGGKTLPLLAARLTASARGGIARVTLEQRFRNPFPDPLRVTYLFPLPHDGAVSGFAFLIGDRRIVGEVDRRAAARERFEEAIASGRTAGLVDEERGSVFTQELGNVPPGAEIVAELTVDQRLAWLPSGAWEWRFPTTVAPRFQGLEGRVPDRDRIRVDVADSPLPPRLALALRIDDALTEGRSPESPSHPVSFRPSASGLDATFSADGGVPLDRDVVVRWPVAVPRVGVGLEVFRPASGPIASSAFGLLTLVPPAADARPPRFPRDLVALLDTSGSMSGAPLDQARRVLGALVETLHDEDTLELIEFSNAPRRWKRSPTHATEAAKRQALAWLARLQAGGSTEMHAAIAEALAGIRPDAQRQVLLVTDGLIGFEQEIVGEVLKSLPPASRLHTLGVGSSVNRSLLGPAARAGRGTESIVGIGEDVERAIRTLVARMEAPLVTELEVSGDALVEHAPARLPDLCGGAPALLSLRLRPDGGTLRIHGKLPGGSFEHAVRLAPVDTGGRAAIAALFGREAVEDLETRLAAGENAGEIDSAVERLGLEHQISTRLTSWVAIEEEPSVDPTRATRRVSVPHELPYGMSVEGLGLRAPAHAVLASPGVVHALPAFAGAPSRFRSFLKEKAADREEVAAKLLPRAGAVPARHPGRIVLERDGELVVEIDVTEPVTWSPPLEVTLVASDGRRATASVDARRTTAAAELARGATIRLVLRIGATGLASSDVDALELAVETPDGDLEWVIELAKPSVPPTRRR